MVLTEKLRTLLAASLSPKAARSYLCVPKFKCDILTWVSMGIDWLLELLTITVTDIPSSLTVMGMTDSQTNMFTWTTEVVNTVIIIPA